MYHTQLASATYDGLKMIRGYDRVLPKRTASLLSTPRWVLRNADDVGIDTKRERSSVLILKVRPKLRRGNHEEAG